MTQPAFFINDHYEVNPADNLIKDLSSGQEIKLETPLTQLLCMLINSEGELVEHEIITKEIWNDEANADDELREAIAVLREILYDDVKVLIETVPKRGYMIRTTIRVKDTDKKKDTKAQWIVPGAIVAVAAIGIGIYLYTRQSTPPQKISEITTASDTTKLPADYATTIEHTTSDGRTYKLISKDGKQLSFYINNELMPIDTMNAHSDLVSQMKSELNKRRKK
ncbi:MAG: winged helix-turn-helix domain-containing protein [Filimonas sp.]|nr:winged helix-turn-helix domain-containing protein [Filimonas sp.]